MEFTGAFLATRAVAAAASKVAEIVSASALVPAKGVTAAASVAAQMPLSPAQALLDLRVPQSIQDVLGPPLGELGFSLCEEKVTEKYGRGIRYFTVVRKGAAHRILIHVAPWILSVYADDHRNALAGVPYDFPRSTVLFVFSERLDSAERTLRGFIQDGWKEQRAVTAIFIPWRDIDDLKTADPQRKQQTVKDMLQLSNGSNGDDEIKLTQKEKKTIRTILLNAAMFEDVGARKATLFNAGLDKLFEGINLSGDGSTVVGKVLAKLVKYGWLGDRPGTHSLGALLAYMCEQEELNEDKKSALQEIINKYQLLPRN